MEDDDEMFQLHNNLCADVIYAQRSELKKNVPGGNKSGGKKWVLEMENGFVRVNGRGMLFRKGRCELGMGEGDER